MRQIDLAGQRFGRLVAIERMSDGDHRGKWLCKCDCGSETFVETGNLRRGNSTSCGCKRIESTTKIRPGMEFGRLIVVERFGSVRYKNKSTPKYLCKCACGTDTVVFGISLTSGSTRSCGCLLRESSKQNGKNSLDDLSGSSFGRLSVIGRASIEGDVPTKWLCACSCGRLKIISATSLKTGNTLSCGCAKANGEEIAPDHVRLRRRINTGKRRAYLLGATKPFDPEFFDLIESEAHGLCLARQSSTGIEWQVDHIVPLQSEFVCGLHNEFNLRVISQSENSSKKNRYWPDMP